MGCGASTAGQSDPVSTNHKAAIGPQLKPIPKANISDSEDDPDYGYESCEHHNGSMKRVNPPKKMSGAAETSLQPAKSEVFDATVEEVQEAMNIVEKFNLNEVFDKVKKTVTTYRQFREGKNTSTSHRQFIHECCEQFSENPSAVCDVFALVGGVKLMVQLYADELKSLGVTHLTESTLDMEAAATLKALRIMLVDATDSSLTLGCKLAKAGLFPYLAEDIKHLPADFDAADAVFDESVTILHNCAQNPSLRQNYRDIGAVKFLSPHLVRTEAEIKLLTLLTLSYIIDEEDNHLLMADDSVFDALLKSLSKAWASEVHRDNLGYHLIELLKGMGNLAQNDDNKKLLMKKGALTLLIQVLAEGSEEEQQYAAKIVWELAFYKENRQEMKQNAELMKHLNTVKSGSHKEAAKNAGGALWVLDMDRMVNKETVPQAPPPPRRSRATAPPPPPPGAALFGGLSTTSQIASAPPPPPPPPGGAGDQGHIMISYQWANQKMLMQIRDSLKEHGFKVWMDVDNIHGSTLQAMADAVEGASVVLMCMTQRYKDSPNCRTEAEYAFALQKKIVPLLMERDYKADGWLGILQGSKLFFNFSGKYPYEKKIDELVKELGFLAGVNQEETEGPIIAQKVAPVGSAPKESVADWSEKDVTNWLHKHQLNKCSKLRTLTGENIKFLQKLSMRAPEFYFNYLKQDLGLSDLTDLMHLSDAIDKLP